MARVVGIDPGTLGFDLCGLDGGRLFLEASIDAEEAARAPERLVEHLARAGPLDLVVAPSGYGLPLTPLDQVDDAALDLVTLVRPEDRAQPEMVGGLRAMLGMMRRAGFPAVLVPGVVHLPSVPPHRKVNRVDMGTADKVCAAALAVHDQAIRLGIAPAETRLILVELGGVFTAALAIDGGAIVDGVGGTGGGLGYRALGTLDGEVAYLLGRVRKRVLFGGGAAALAGDPALSPDALVARAATEAGARTALLALLESVEKTVAALRVSVPEPREVLLSGRLAGVPAIAEGLATRLGRQGPVRRLTGFAASVKEAAQGAALLADGLAGGLHRGLVDALRLREARGTVLDHLHVDGAAGIRRDFGVP